MRLHVLNRLPNCLTLARFFLSPPSYAVANVIFQQKTDIYPSLQPPQAPLGLEDMVASSPILMTPLFTAVQSSTVSIKSDQSSPFSHEGRIYLEAAVPLGTFRYMPPELLMAVAPRKPQLGTRPAGNYCTTVFILFFDCPKICQFLVGFTSDHFITFESSLFLFTCGVVCPHVAEPRSGLQAWYVRCGSSGIHDCQVSVSSILTSTWLFAKHMSLWKLIFLSTTQNYYGRANSLYGFSFSRTAVL